MSEPPVNPSAMTVDQAAGLLGVEADEVRRWLEDGLPADAGGRIHLVECAAWLASQLAQ